MPIRPLGERILLEILEDDLEKKGSLYIPDTAKEKPQKGKIIAVGPGRYEKGELIPLNVHVGDVVLYSKYSGTEIKHDNKEYLIVRENDIMAIIE